MSRRKQAETTHKEEIHQVLCIIKGQGKIRYAKGSNN